MRAWGNRIAFLLLGLHLILVAWGATRHSPNLMEAVDLPAGLSHLRFANFELRKVNPPLVRTIAAIPVAIAGAESDWGGMSDAPGARPEFAVGRDFVEVNGRRSFWLFTLARWACLPLTLLGGFVCYRWSRELYGEPAGLFAVTLWCFDPTILGHAMTMNSDVPAAAMGVAAGFTFWQWLKRPCWRTAMIAGVMLGLALLTRTTLIVLVPLWGILWLAHGVRRKSPVAPARQFLILVGLAIYLLNLGYGFEGTGRSLGEYPFVSRTFGCIDPEPEAAGNRFRGSWLEHLPLPLPKNFVEGVDLQKRDFENEAGRFRSYLLGEWSDRGWWYYYLYGLGVKWPVGTLVLAALSFLGWLVAWCRSPSLTGKGFIPLLSGATIFLLVSSQSGFSTHFRYSLPVFPFLFVLMSSIAARGRVWRSAGVMALVLSVCSSLFIWPHCMSYFNEVAGGPHNGHHHLLHSSIDWGQDWLFLEKWTDEHPEAHKIRIACSGPTPPELIGLESASPPMLRKTENGQFDPTSGPGPGWYAVSVNDLHEERYAYFLEFEPVATAGYSIFIFHLEKDEVSYYWKNQKRFERGQSSR